MTMKKFLLPSLLLLTLVACIKDEEEPFVERDYTAAVDNDRAELFFTDALRMSDAAYKDGELPCAVAVTIDTVTVPHTMLIDFGPTNCTAPDGRTRRGRLNVTFTGRYRDPGTVITITPEDYYVNDHHLQGLKTVTNAGLNGQGQPFFNVTVSGTVTAPDGSWTSTHSFQRTRTWVEGASTVNWLDDVYLIAGGGSGVNRRGIPYTMIITTPLRVELDCPWIVRGVMQIIPDGLSMRSVNYGDGTCDGQVSVTVNGSTFTFGG
jgi:hypothetical protein